MDFTSLLREALSQGGVANQPQQRGITDMLPQPNDSTYAPHDILKSLVAPGASQPQQPSGLMNLGQPMGQALGMGGLIDLGMGGLIDQVPETGGLISLLSGLFGGSQAQAAQPAPDTAPAVPEMAPPMAPPLQAQDISLNPPGSQPMPELASLFGGGGSAGAPAAPQGPAPSGEILPWKVPNPEPNPMRAPGAGEGTDFASILRAAMIGAGNADTSRSIGGSFVSGMGAGAKAISGIEKEKEGKARQTTLDAERKSDKAYSRSRDEKLDGLRAEEKARNSAVLDIKTRMAKIQLKAAQQKLERGDQLTVGETLRLAELDKDIGNSVRERYSLDPDVDVDAKINEERERLFKTYPMLEKLIANPEAASGGAPSPGTSAAPAAQSTPSKVAYDKTGRAVTKNAAGQWVYDDGTPYKP